MARAIIHNSNYSSVDECKNAIDRYFLERNNEFIANPERAGKRYGVKKKFYLYSMKVIIAKILTIVKGYHFLFQ